MLQYATYLHIGIISVYYRYILYSIQRERRLPVLKLAALLYRNNEFYTVGSRLKKCSGQLGSTDSKEKLVQRWKCHVHTPRFSLYTTSMSTYLMNRTTVKLNISQLRILHCSVGKHTRLLVFASNFSTRRLNLNIFDFYSLRWKKELSKATRPFEWVLLFVWKNVASTVAIDVAYGYFMYILYYRAYC